MEVLCKCLPYVGFREVKDHSLRMTPFPEVFGMCLPYVKGYCQQHQGNTFVFRAQMSQILLFLGMPDLLRSKITA